MDDLLIHPKTKRLLKIQLSNPSQSVMITGSPGSNKLVIAKSLIAEMLGIGLEELDNYIYFLDISNEEKISIEDIRSIQKFIKLKVLDNSNKPIKRIILISSADNMRVEAQNALLKTLEEPPQETMILLISAQKSRLLSTIISRVQEIEVLPVSYQQAKSYYKQKVILPTNFESLFALSQGFTGLLDALVKSSEHQLLIDISLAKTIFAESKGQRLIRVDEVSKDKKIAEQLLSAMLKISHAALVSASKKNDQKSINRWSKTQKEIVQSILYLKSNVNTKLVFDNLFVSI